jgi:hypothetical protein
MSLTPLGEVVLTVELATAVVLVGAAVPELFEVVVGERDGATVVRGVVVAVVADVPEVAGTPAKAGAALQLAIVNVEQSLANKFLIRPYSL